MSLTICVPLIPGSRKIPYPVKAMFVLSWIVNPSMTTLLAATLVPCESATIDSAPREPRASTPACAPSRLRVLLMVRGPPAASGYVPAATLMVSPAVAWLIASWMVRHGITVAQQELRSLPAVLTRQVAPQALDASSAQRSIRTALPHLGRRARPGKTFMKIATSKPACCLIGNFPGGRGAHPRLRADMSFREAEGKPS